MQTRFRLMLLLALAAALVPPLAAPARAGEALLAVAANFAEVTDILGKAFTARTGHKLTVTVGSTGKLYAQILNGAPFDIFLAADRRRPELLERGGLALAGSRFTYATGRLSLWSANPGTIGADGPAVLKQGGFRALAIANPALAPYGRAARETLTALKLWQALKSRIVMGQNAGQTFALISSGNAELGFIPRSARLSPRNPAPGSYWDIPAELHSPIRQDALVLARAAKNPAATAFMRFLKSPEAVTVIRQFGYGVD